MQSRSGTASLSKECEVLRSPVAALSKLGYLYGVGIRQEDDELESSECRPISGVDEVIEPLFPIGSPTAISTPEGFIAAWIREDGGVRACDLGSLESLPEIVDVGESAATRIALRQMIHPDGDFVRFIWKDVNDDIIERRIPRELDGFARLSKLERWFCNAFGERDEKN